MASKKMKLLQEAVANLRNLEDKQQREPTVCPRGDQKSLKETPPKASRKRPQREPSSGRSVGEANTKRRKERGEKREAETPRKDPKNQPGTSRRDAYDSNKEVQRKGAKAALKPRKDPPKDRP